MKPDRSRLSRERYRVVATVPAPPPARSQKKVYWFRCRESARGFASHAFDSGAADVQLWDGLGKLLKEWRAA